MRAWRAGRDAGRANAALAAIGAAAQGEENLLPRLIDAVKMGVTVGEIGDALRAVWGEHREVLTL